MEELTKGIPEANGEERKERRKQGKEEDKGRKPEEKQNTNYLCIWKGVERREDASVLAGVWKVRGKLSPY